MSAVSTSHMKIIFSGSVGAGKTTAIQAVSDIDVVSTDELASDEVREVKETTTVALDYGQINLPDGTKIHLYGTPGQARFDFMWSLLAEGAIGVIVLIDDTSNDPLAELDAYLEAFSRHHKQRSLVVAVTRADLDKGHSLETYRKHVARYQGNIPVFSIDARDDEQVKALVKILLYRIDPWLH